MNKPGDEYLKKTSSNDVSNETNSLIKKESSFLEWLSKKPNRANWFFYTTAFPILMMIGFAGRSCRSKEVPQDLPVSEADTTEYSVSNELSKVKEKVEFLSK